MPTVYATAIKRAIEIVGVDEFCKRAKISRSDLALCLERESTADTDVFFATADVMWKHAANASIRKDASGSTSDLNGSPSTS
jgi:hypothetical protein